MPLEHKFREGNRYFHEIVGLIVLCILFVPYIIYQLGRKAWTQS